jgi:hypothetical protein
MSYGNVYGVVMELEYISVLNTEAERIEGSNPFNATIFYE